MAAGWNFTDVDNRIAEELKLFGLSNKEEC
jgi:hypothetical protein